MNGKGIYMARFARYSHGYAPKGAGDVRNMYYCRCLVGDYAISTDENRLTAPEKQPKKYIYYDCTTSSKDTVMFVFYDSDQIYPQYHIKYIIPTDASS